MKSPRRKKARPSRKIEKSEFTINSPLHMTDEEWGISVAFIVPDCSGFCRDGMVEFALSEFRPRKQPRQDWLECVPMRYL